MAKKAKAKTKRTGKRLASQTVTYRLERPRNRREEETVGERKEDGGIAAKCLPEPASGFKWISNGF